MPRKVTIGPGKRMWVDTDGKYVVETREDNRQLLEMQQRRRQEARRNPHSAECRDGGRQLANYPRSVLREMQQKCGNDPDKQKAFLRDHAEWLSVPKGQAGLPKKRVYSFPK